MGRVDGASNYSEEDEYCQEKFKLLTANCGKSYRNKDIAVNVRIGRKFLYKYAKLLPTDVREGVLSEN